MEVHKEINKAKSLTERATTSMNKAKSKAAEEGIDIPTIAPAPVPAPAPVVDQSAAMLKMMEIMANEIRTLKAPPPVPAEPKPKAAPKPKAEPKPKKVKEEAPPPVNIAVPQVSMTPHQVRMTEQSLRIDNLRKALGRN